MKKLLSIIVLIIICISTHAKQSSISLTGRVRDKVTQASVMNAKVAIYDLKHNLVDSARAYGGYVDPVRKTYEIVSDFSMAIPKMKGIYTIEVTHEDYDTLRKSLDLTKIGSRETDRKIGTFYMSKERLRTLGEVSVTASKVKFYFKGDTIVYNADAFSLPEGSMLDALIKQMPNVEIRDGGEIYVNGQYVDALLLNGKDFFNKDKELMLNNIGAYTVNSVEVYDRQTDVNKFKDNDSEIDKEYVMDVKLKKEYIGGWNFTLEGGYGSHDRYMGRFFGMHFTALKQFTLFANINNLNNNQKPGSGGTDMTPTINSGLYTTKDFGFDYTIENDDATRKYFGNVVLEIGDNLLKQSSISTKILPTANTYVQSLNSSDTHSLNLKSSFVFQWQTNTTFNKISPTLSHAYNRNDLVSKTINYLSEQKAETMRDALEQWPEKGLPSSAKEELITAIFNESTGRNYTTKYGIDASTTIKIPRTSDNLGLSLTAGRTESPSFDNSIFLIDYGDKSIKPVARRQYTRNKPVGKTNIEAASNYELKLSPALKFSLNYRFRYEKDSNTSDFYLANVVSDYSGDYTIDNLHRMSMEYDSSNSHYSNEGYIRNTAAAGMHWRIEKNMSLSINYHTHFANKWLNYNQQRGHQNIHKSGIELWQQTAYFYQHAFSNNRQFRISVTNVLNRNLPSLIKMIDIDNTTDPLSRYLPNPTLKPVLSDDLSYYASLFLNKVTISIWGAARWVHDDAVNGYIYDTSSGVSTYKTYNVDGNRSSLVQLSTSYAFNQNRRINIQVYDQYQVYHNMIGENAELPVKSRVTRKEYSLPIRYDDHVFSCLSYNLSVVPRWIRSKSALQPHLNLNVNEIKYSGAFLLKLPHGWEVSTDLSIKHRSGYTEPKINGNEYIWNGSITKSLVKNKLILSLFAYDLLKQVKTVTYSIGADSRVETFSNTLPRYVLFRAIYKINISPKNHKLNQSNSVKLL